MFLHPPPSISSSVYLIQTHRFIPYCLLSNRSIPNIEKNLRGNPSRYPLLLHAPPPHSTVHPPVNISHLPLLVSRCRVRKVTLSNLSITQTQVYLENIYMLISTALNTITFQTSKIQPSYPSHKSTTS